MGRRESRGERQQMGGRVVQRKTGPQPRSQDFCGGGEPGMCDISLTTYLCPHLKKCNDQQAGKLVGGGAAGITSNPSPCHLQLSWDCGWQLPPPPLQSFTWDHARASHSLGSWLQEAIMQSQPATLLPWEGVEEALEGQGRVSRQRPSLHPHSYRPVGPFPKLICCVW